MYGFIVGIRSIRLASVRNRNYQVSRTAILGYDQPRTFVTKKTGVILEFLWHYAVAIKICFYFDCFALIFVNYDGFPLYFDINHKSPGFHFLSIKIVT